MLTKEIKHYIDNSVLCWLATISSQGQPNVSPKEVFTYLNNHDVVIANIASPQSSINIKSNDKVCISFIDVIEQVGYKLNGKSDIIQKKESSFMDIKDKLEVISQGKFPFDEIFKIEVISTKKIIAPSYIFFPDESKEEKMLRVRKNYGLTQEASD